MAHMIMADDHMVSGNNIVPWHGLGTVVEGLMTAKEALELAKLDWNVSVRQLSFPGDDGQQIIVPGQFATVRDDIQRPLGVVKSRYTPLQNKDAFSFFDALVTEKEAMYETAGSLHNGSKVWILAKLPQDIVLLNEDEIKTYVLIYTSHDGSARCKIKLTNQRVVCQNTVNMALKGAGAEIAISHTPKITDKIRQAHEVLGLMSKTQKELKEMYERMAQKELNSAATMKFLNDCFNLDVEKESDYEKLDELMGLAEAGAGTNIKGVRGTVWGAYNAATEYVNHHIKYRDEESRMNSLTFGQGASVSDRALALATTLIR